MTTAAHIRKVYQKIRKKISCSFDEFELFQCNVLTRNFHGLSKSDFIAPKWLKVNEKNQNAMMVPLLDICNHWSPNNAKYSFGKF